MEKQEILGKFLENGLQLDYESLEYFFNHQDRIRLFFDVVQQEERPKILTKDYLSSVLDAQGGLVEVVKSYSPGKRTLSVDEVTRILHERYSYLKKILSSRLDLINPISINKINPKIHSFSSVIMVKEKFDDDNSILAEDDTGEEKFFFENREDYEQILPDDTVGIVCENSGKLVIKSVMWPDFQLNRSINKTETDTNIVAISAGFSAELMDKIKRKRLNEDVMIFVEKGGNITIIDKINTKLRSPSVIKVKNSVIVSISESSTLTKYEGFEKDPEKFLTSLLRRRNLSPTFSYEGGYSDKDPYLIDTLPDVMIFSGLKMNFSTNYKGTLVIGVEDFELENKIWVINLKTRETINLPVGV